MYTIFKNMELYLYMHLTETRSRITGLDLEGLEEGSVRIGFGT